MTGDVVQKLWGLCHTLRHDGIDYGDYIEQVTYLLFLKMADEKAIDLSAVPFEAADGETVTLDCSWPGLTAESGTKLADRYADALRALGRRPGLLGDIFGGAQSRFGNPVNLKRVMNAVDETEWTSLETNVKADAFEGLLEKAASEGKKGAGQYFTPRLLIRSVVRVMKPDPRRHGEFAVCDPACGTGEFLVSAYDWFVERTGGAMPRELAKRVRKDTYFGQDLVARPRRLALMNLYLHGLEPQIKLGDSIDEAPDARRYDVILTNPPFGTKGANQAPARDDFTVETSNKQLNFLQHVLTTLRPGGRAAAVVPDNCLFADAAGEVFRVLAEDADLHTVLRLPNGTFTPYSPGTKTNVVFFTKGRRTERTWIYDARTNVPRVTKKDRPLTAEHFAEFERCYGDDPDGTADRTPDDSPAGDGWRGGDRWRSFSIAEVRDRDFKLDGLRWLRDDSLEDASDLPDPDELAGEALAELELATAELTEALALLEDPEALAKAVRGGDGA